MRAFRNLLAPVAAMAALAAVPVAQAHHGKLHTSKAHVHKVTGQSTTITPSAGVTKFLASHNVTVTAVRGATISGGSVTLPIKGGRVDANGHAVLRHTGGIRFSTASRKITLHGFVLRVGTKHGELWARVHRHRLLIAKLVKVTESVSGNSGTVSGTLLLSARAAHKINHRLGSKTVSAGTDLGTLVSHVTAS